MRVDEFEKPGQFAPLARFVPVALQWSSAVMFLVAWRHFPSDSAIHFGKLMELEFLAIHAGAFLGFLILWSPLKRSRRLLRCVGLLVFSFLYLAGGYSTLRWSGVIEIGAMIFTSYSGLFWSADAKRTARIMETGARWFLGFIVFLFVINGLSLAGDVATWHKSADALLAGAIYFAVLGLLELSGIYRLVRKNADKLMRGSRPRS